MFQPLGKGGRCPRRNVRGENSRISSQCVHPKGTPGRGDRCGTPPGFARKLCPFFSVPLHSSRLGVLFAASKLPKAPPSAAPTLLPTPRRNSPQLSELRVSPPPPSTPRGTDLLVFISKVRPHQVAVVQRLREGPGRGLPFRIATETETQGCPAGRFTGVTTSLLPLPFIMAGGGGFFSGPPSVALSCTPHFAGPLVTSLPGCPWKLKTAFWVLFEHFGFLSRSHCCSSSLWG